ncbi:IclR family transcriptional regulator [Oceaniferula spumae]|uniref:IclR family transcriptional regulator n=1 Tax=Oceaniferula spumae TaxID=2979115 RepID=A0AAT9FM80_9BACT
MNNYRIPSISNTCAIFQLLTSTRKAMSASEIAKELELPRTSVFRVLKTLEEEGMVRGVGKNYVMGHRLINLGLQVVSQIPERQLCVPILRGLTDETGESSHFAILSGSNSLLIEVCDSPHALRVASRPGTLADMHCSASGKCMLAYASNEAREDLLNRIKFNKRTEFTHTSKESLLPELEEVRRLGYAVDNVEYHDHVRCLGAPVFNAIGQVAGAIGITAARSRFPKSLIPDMAKTVISAANKLSAQLGHKP